MTTIYYRPPGPNTARSVALTSWGSGLMLTTWPALTVYQFNGSALITLFSNGGLGGFVDVATDPSGNAWALGYFGQVFKVSPTGAILATFNLTNSFFPGQLIPFTGVAIANGNPFFLLSNGSVYTINAGVAQQVGALMGSGGEEAVGFSSFGSKLYCALPQSQRLATLTLTGSQTGTVTRATTPMLVPANTAASASGVAVVGWNNATSVSGASALALAPNGTFAATVVSGTNAVMLLSGLDPNWQLINSVAGQGAPVDLTWASSGEQVLVTDTAHAEVSIYNLVSNALSFGANVAATGANHIDVTPDGLTALVTRTSGNAIAVLGNTANTWTTRATVTLANSPGQIAVISQTSAVVGYVPPSGTGGLAWLALVNGNWGVQSTITNLIFPVSGLYVDTAGIVYAVGTTGTTTTTGHLAAVTQTGGIIASTTWTGRGDAVLSDQGQIAVIDSSS